MHLASRGTYGIRRVQAELTLGLGLQVGHNQVELLMARAAIKGLPGNRRPRPRHETSTATDLVERMFTREAPNRLWANDPVLNVRLSSTKNRANRHAVNRQNSVAVRNYFRGYFITYLEIL